MSPELQSFVFKIAEYVGGLLLILVPVLVSGVPTTTAGQLNVIGLLMLGHAAGRS